MIITIIPESLGRYLSVLKKVDIYILKNIFFSFIASFFIITAVMLIGDIIKIYDILFTEGTSLKLMVSVFAHIIVFLSVFVLPMSLTISVNYVYSDMSHNSEIIALKNAGISLLRIYLPAFIFTVFVFLILSYDLFSLAYKARMSYRLELTNILKNRVYAALKPSIFYKVSGNVLWVKSMSVNHKKLKDVFFFSKGKVFVSKKAILKDMPTGILANLYNVKMFSKKKGVLEYGSFKRYDMILYFHKVKKKKKYDVGYLTINQIYNDYKKTHSKDDLFEMNKRISLALGVFIFSIIAFSLGITFSRGGKSFGIVVNIFLFFVFYIFLMLGQSVYEANSIIWLIYLPNIVLSILGAYLFYVKTKG